VPVKRRTAKRRLDARAEAEAWESVFDCEYDFFDALPEIGVETDEYGRVDREVAEEAWHRLGNIFLAERPSQGVREPWALKQFGPPR
jgi:hypothetical protein